MFVICVRVAFYLIVFSLLVCSWLVDLFCFFVCVLYSYEVLESMRGCFCAWYCVFEYLCKFIVCKSAGLSVSQFIQCLLASLLPLEAKAYPIFLFWSSYICFCVSFICASLFLLVCVFSCMCIPPNVEINVKKDIRGFQVAVNYTMFMTVVETFEDLGPP